MRETRTILAKTKEELEIAQNKIVMLSEKMDDLKLQVREELTKTDKLEQVINYLSFTFQN